jgi:hypothetical protein
MNKRDKRSNVKKNHAKACTLKHDSALSFYVRRGSSICDLHLKTFLPQIRGQQSKASDQLATMHQEEGQRIEAATCRRGWRHRSSPAAARNELKQLEAL